MKRDEMSGILQERKRKHLRRGVKEEEGKRPRAHGQGRNRLKNHENYLAYPLEKPELTSPKDKPEKLRR